MGSPEEEKMVTLELPASEAKAVTQFLKFATKAKYLDIYSNIIRKISVISQEFEILSILAKKRMISGRALGLVMNIPHNTMNRRLKKLMGWGLVEYSNEGNGGYVLADDKLAEDLEEAMKELNLFS